MFLPQAIKAIDNGERLEQPVDCPDHVYEIMRRCWEFEAHNRPTFSELLDLFTADTDYINIKDLVTEMNLS